MKEYPEATVIVSNGTDQTALFANKDLEPVLSVSFSKSPVVSTNVENGLAFGI